MQEFCNGCHNCSCLFFYVFKVVRRHIKHYEPIFNILLTVSLTVSLKRSRSALSGNTKGLYGRSSCVLKRGSSMDTPPFSFTLKTMPFKRTVGHPKSTSTKHVFFLTLLWVILCILMFIG